MNDADGTTGACGGSTAASLFCGDASDCPFRNARVAQRTQRSALTFAALAYSVYPASVHSQAHHKELGSYPQGEGGWKIASSDVKQVVAWGATLGRADCNVGVSTGAASALVVIDIDRPREEKLTPGADGVTFGDTPRPRAGIGEASDRVRAWARERGVYLPGTAVVETPSGGTHIWLRLPAHRLDVEVPRRIGWLDRVDLLWDKHSIKAPPSERGATRHKAGGTYEFVRGCPCEVPVASDALLDAMIDTDERVSSPISTSWGVGGGDDGTGAGESARAGGGGAVDLDAVRNGVPLGLPEGQNGVFWRTACSLARRGFTHLEAVEFMVDVSRASPVGNDGDPWTRDDFTNGGGYGLVDRAFVFVESKQAEEQAIGRALHDSMHASWLGRK